ENATFTANGSWDLNGSLVYHWDFGDGTYGAGWQTSKQYAASGTYHVTLNVTNSFGVSTIVVHDIVVQASSQGVTAAGIPVGMMAIWAIVAIGAVVAVAIYVRRRTHPPKP
ncbi:MAG: PKD domain-containing protein, partial [Methanobacteriota archaeon]